MALFLAEHWVWDFWFVQDGDHTHLFYLSAPRNLDDPNLRHWNVRIGHAWSVDLKNWEILPDALWPAATPSWDDYTTWTGCVVRAEAGHWMMFYTGTSKAEDGCVQRIGVACSDDLIVWRRRTETPLLQADLRYYESLDLNIWYEQAFRDPWVFPDPKGDGWHMFSPRVSHRASAMLVESSGTRALLTFGIGSKVRRSSAPNAMGTWRCPSLWNTRDVGIACFASRIPTLTRSTPNAI